MSDDPDPDPLLWDLSAAINLLNSLSIPQHDSNALSPLKPSPEEVDDTSEQDLNLGDFSKIWKYLGRPPPPDDEKSTKLVKYEVNDVLVGELDLNQLSKAVRWRDEVDGADLEDNVEPNKLTAAALRNRKRAERRARAKERAEKLNVTKQSQVSDTTDFESGEELESLRRPSDRRAVIDSILGLSRPTPGDISSPPTSPSPPKAEVKTPKRSFPVSNPFLWTTTDTSSPRRAFIGVKDGLTPRARKQALIAELMQRYPDEKKYLKNSGLLEPAFTPLNISKIGVHVFVDISNITIGFHDCLKLARGMSRETRLKRVPFSFHNFSLVLERGRPAAKRVLGGSDTYPTVTQAKSLGYETNILKRVTKAKELTPRQKKYRSGGETSGSETNNPVFAPEKWVEQGVDEILHLKMLESIIDAEKPSTIVLATGDAAEAEYSGGFLRMVERALERGWLVELVSFKQNTSSLYKRKEFRCKWGPMFKLVELDPFVEFLIEEEEDI